MLHVGVRKYEIQIKPRSRICAVEGVYSPNTRIIGLKPTRAQRSAVPLRMYVSVSLSRGLVKGRSPAEGNLLNVYKKDRIT